MRRLLAQPAGAKSIVLPFKMRSGPPAGTQLWMQGRSPTPRRCTARRNALLEHTKWGRPPRGTFKLPE